MLFNSLEFLIFFPIVIFLYFITPHRFRWVLLLVASYYFYMCWRADYIILIILSTIIDYYAGMKMSAEPEKSKRKKYLALSLLSNLSILFFFKYFNFFNTSARDLFDFFNLSYEVPMLNVLLPVGISFYTFQTMSYSIDVYNGKCQTTKNPGIFALYVSFFPQLVAGPIERSGNLLSQFYKEHKFDTKRIANGLRLILWGFFKKLVIADRLALYVNEVFNNPTEYNGLPVLIACYFFAFQIYCDFSGYSDIAIGSAQVMGFKLMDNFRRPYFSKSIAEFWQRWHISLSTWFRDYLYIPLGGNRVSSKWKWYWNISVVFLVSGLWHGANWTFVVWGGLHAFYFVFSLLTKKYRSFFTNFFKLNKLPTFYKFLQMLITFHLVVFAWIFFRANNIGDAFVIIQNLQSISLSDKILINGNLTEFIIAIVAIAFMEIIHLFERGTKLPIYIESKPLWLRWCWYYTMLFSILLFSVVNKSPFLYFQF